MHATSTHQNLKHTRVICSSFKAFWCGGSQARVEGRYTCKYLHGCFSVSHLAAAAAVAPTHQSYPEVVIWWVKFHGRLHTVMPITNQQIQHIKHSPAQEQKDTWLLALAPLSCPSAAAAYCICLTKLIKGQIDRIMSIMIRSINQWVCTACTKHSGRTITCCPAACSCRTLQVIGPDRSNKSRSKGHR